MTKSEQDKADLDLIQMVQKARMMHDAETKPSEVAAVYWIEVKCQTDDCKSPTARAGQWVLDTIADQVDAQWALIREATEQGKLGYKSKVSTAGRSGTRADSRTIAVRTYDSADAHDKARVLEVLRSLNIPGEWRYESDES